MKKIVRNAFRLMFFLFVSNCSSSVDVPNFLPQFKVENSPKIVLVTIDGVRWQEMFEGTDLKLHKGRPLSSREILPNVYHYFVDEGSAFGKDSLVSATGKIYISLPGYLEMMRGHSTLDCITNACEPELKTTLLDFFENVAVFSSWDTVRKSATGNPERIIMNSGRNYRTKRYDDLGLQDNKDFVCDIGGEDYRPDSHTIVAVMSYLERDRPQFLWVSLGDTDEHAHKGNYKAYLSSIKKFDFFIGELIQMYDENTVFIITTDHGRSEDWENHGFDPESGRVWLMIHGKGVHPRGFVKLKEPRSLSNIMPTVLKMTHGIKAEKTFI
jgi:hypothetical protein